MLHPELTWPGFPRRPRQNQARKVAHGLCKIGWAGFVGCWWKRCVLKTWPSECIQANIPLAGNAQNPLKSWNVWDIWRGIKEKEYSENMWTECLMKWLVWLTKCQEEKKGPAASWIQSDEKLSPEGIKEPLQEWEPVQYDTKRNARLEYVFLHG